MSSAIFSALLSLISFLFSTYVSVPASTVTTTPRFSSSTTYIVQRVVDGDTVVLETGEKVRYTGVNTPETVDPRRPVQCFGKEAKVFNTKLVLGQTVRLERDVRDKDKYNRLLRYVYLSDGTMVNETLVREGYAMVETVPPDVKYKNIFIQAQQEAREAKRGLWAACTR